MVKKLLGDAVREERLRRNLSQNSLAEQAKISLRTVSDIENYIGNPQLETLYALATYLHISIDAIFSNQKTNPDSTMQQIMAELNSCPEEQKQLALSTLRGLLDGFKNLNFIPSSIVEIPTDKSDEMYIIPEIILINNSLCVLTQDNGKGWELTDKDNIVISFDKYKSDITVSQDLIIGYVKDGIMYEGEVFDELSGKYSFSPDEKGEYFFYLLSGSSDYLSLKSGNLEVN